MTDPIELPIEDPDDDDCEIINREGRAVALLREMSAALSEDETGKAWFPVLLRIGEFLDSRSTAGSRNRVAEALYAEIPEGRGNRKIRWRFTTDAERAESYRLADVVIAAYEEEAGNA